MPVSRFLKNSLYMIHFAHLPRIIITGITTPLVVSLLMLALSGCQHIPEPVTNLTSGIDLNNLSTDVRPQDDFYEYVNGGWLKRNSIPADKSGYGAFTELADKTEVDLRQLIKEISLDTSAEYGSARQKIRDFYNAYMKLEEGDGAGLEAINDVITKIETASTHKDIIQLMGELSIIGITSPFRASVFSDLKSPDNNILYLSQSGLTLPDREYYLGDNPQYTKGKGLLKTYLTALMEALEKPNSTRTASELLSLETALARIQMSKEDNRDPDKTYHKKTHAELLSLTEDFPWEVLLQSARIEPQENYIVEQPDYFSSLGEIFINTPVMQWKEYLTFKTIHTFSSVLGDPWFQLKFDFSSRGLYGKQTPRPVWKRAIASLNGNLGELLGQLYVEKHFPPESRDRMQMLVSNLFSAYRQSINELEWMNETTKKAAITKLEKFTTKIGYPEKWKDYSQLDITTNNIVENLKRSASFKYTDNVSRLGKPVDKAEWGMTPQTVNAYYNPAWNEIVFPAAILQAPFFNAGADDAVNYGAIGAVIGHEISHGFDDQGRKFNGDGELENWWAEEDSSRFLRLKKQLSDQYDKYTVAEDLHVNGEFTSGENIADLGGVSTAYKAYQLSLSGSKAPIVDRLTGEQRFFMGWAQVWRTLYRDERLKLLVTTDPHSPAKYRTNGVLINQPAFYQAFSVKAGDLMYIPAGQHIKIW